MTSLRPIPVPDISTPIILDQEGAATPDLGPLAHLKGNWNSSPSAAMGYNVMPLPQITAPNQFVLKDFSYYEQMTIGAIDGNIVNRDGAYQQNCATLFYDQRVYFGAQQEKNKLIHAENGSWLHLTKMAQGQGAYQDQGPIPSPPAPDPVPRQNPNYNIYKQASVPHGNSILATGHVEIIHGAPDIPNVSSLPFGPGVDPGFYRPYGANDPSNPTVNPNFVLQKALLGQRSNIEQTLIITVSTKNPHGGVTNIQFEDKRARVLSYSMTIWLERFRGQTEYTQLQYSQSIELTLMQHDITFPHIDANTLTRIPCPNGANYL